MKAHELFAKLGYVLLSDGELDRMVFFKKNQNENEAFDYQVVFNLGERTFKIQDDWGDSYAVGYEVLEAIVYQMKELGWL